MAKKNKKKSSPIATILFIIALGVFLYAAFQLVSLGLRYHKGTVEYKDVAETAGMTEELPEDPEEVTVDTLQVPDFASLLATNPDTIGWIRFQEPKIINYPIVYSKDNTNYLYTTFAGTDNFAGSIFSDMNCKQDFSDENVIIYGHAMKNQSMFGSLKEYKSEDYFKQNPYFYIFTKNGGVYRYKICAAYETVDTSDTYQIAFADESSFQTYINTILSRSIYQTGTEVTTSSHLITLSTCTNVTDEGRFVVQGVLEKTLQEPTPAWPGYPWEIIVND